jgi:hypothetical protein
MQDEIQSFHHLRSPRQKKKGSATSMLVALISHTFGVFAGKEKS